MTKCGKEYWTKRQMYVCGSCNHHTVIPICPHCDPIKEFRPDYYGPKFAVVDKRCPHCDSKFQCPKCHSTRLVGSGKDSHSLKQRYACLDCHSHTIHPICPECSEPPPVREVSESGRRCLICGSGLLYCPICGQAMLEPKGNTSWMKGSVRVIRRMFFCVLCQKMTTRPICNCDYPHMTDRARKLRDLRLANKRIIIDAADEIDSAQKMEVET